MGERKPWGLGTAVAALLAALSLVPVIAIARTSAAIDFYHVWLVGPLVASGEAVDVYDPAARRELGARAHRRAHEPGVGDAQRRAATKFRRLETTGTPFLYASLAAVQTGDYDRDRLTFNLVGLAVYLFALAGLAIRLGYGWMGVFGLMAFSLAAFEPLLSDVRVGNVNRLQFGVLAIYALLLAGGGDRRRAPWRSFLAGCCLGVASMWKPNLAIVGGLVASVWWARAESRRLATHAAGVAVGVGAAFLYATVFFGTPEVWLWWFEAAMHLGRDFPISVEEGNFAPLQVARQGYGVDFGAAWAVAWLGLLFLLVRRLATPVPPAEEDDAEVIGLVAMGCAVAILASPLAWLHYYLQAMFLILWALRPGREGLRAGWAYRGAVLLAAWAVSMGPLLQIVVSSAPYRWAALGNAGLVVLLALVAFGLLRPSERPRPSRRAPLPGFVRANSERPAGA